MQARLREFVDRDRFAELIPIIKKPGWTTPAEFYLVSTTIDTISRQLEIVDYLSEGCSRAAGWCRSRSARPFSYATQADASVDDPRRVRHALAFVE